MKARVFPALSACAASLLLFAVLSAAAALAGCDANKNQASFCATYKASYLRRCTETCMATLTKESARGPCEQQCIAVLPADATYASSCVDALDGSSAR